MQNIDSSKENRSRSAGCLPQRGHDAQQVSAFLVLLALLGNGQNEASMFANICENCPGHCVFMCFWCFVKHEKHWETTWSHWIYVPQAPCRLRTANFSAQSLSCTVCKCPSYFVETCSQIGWGSVNLASFWLCPFVSLNKQKWMHECKRLPLTLWAFICTCRYECRKVLKASSMHQGTIEDRGDPEPCGN